MSQQESRPRFVRLALTPEQQAQVKEQTGRASQAIDLRLQDLEERAVPRLGWSNHNETQAVELEERVTPRLGWTANHNEALVVEDLEERVAPRLGWTSNHNETMLDEG